MGPDRSHTRFEADRFASLSVWCGPFRETTGTVALDKAAANGAVGIHVDLASVGAGLDKLNAVLRGPQFSTWRNFRRHVIGGKPVEFVSGAPPA